ncbi:ABC transporter substrate-binding protein [Dactylosporangium sp. CA-092794]|uniref:ABC transporter substrate-binding protein n=1 Tax=Dactylosporangium sp. CA-092794 TaxID=3239929 RepID=UPI003D9033F7
MNRRSLMKAAIAAAFAPTIGSALAACGSDDTSSEGSQVTSWDWLVSQAAWMDEEIKLFQQAHGGTAIKKTTQVTDKYPDLLSLAVRSNTAPDVFQLPRTPAIEEQVSSGWLLPLDKWANDGWKARFGPGWFAEGGNVFGGKTYSAPFNGAGSNLQLYCHHELFKQAGITNPDGTVKLPKTWDDVTKTAEAITAKSGGKAFGLGFGNASNGALAWLVELFCRGAGSVGGTNSLDYRVGKWTYGSDRNYADFLGLLLDWKQRGFIFPTSMSISDEQARAFFSQGKFGMIVNGVWSQATWTQAKFTDYSLVTLPSPTETPQGYFYYGQGSSSRMFGISAKAANPDAAFAWLDWLYSKDAGRRWVKAGLGLSVYPENNDPSLVTFAPFAQYVGTAKTNLPGPDPKVRNPEVAKVKVASVKPDINDVAAGLYTGQLKDVGAALRDLEGRLNKAQDDAIAAAAGAGAKVSAADFTFADWDPTKPYQNKTS